MLSLITLPDSRLRQPSVPVSQPIASDVQKFVLQMFEAMEHYLGIGLAAPQVGQNLRLMVIATAGGARAFINPEILKSSWSKDDYEEGCLSIPGVFGLVRRPKRILVRFLTSAGQRQEEWCEGLLARVYQHEVDHLNGVLFIDRTKRITKGRELLASYGIDNSKRKMKKSK